MAGLFDAPPPPWNPPPAIHRSPSTPQAAPLDLASASLGQDGTKLKLTLTTRGTWQASKLKPSGRRLLCVDVTSGGTKTGLCIGAFQDRLALRRVRAGQRATRIAATVTQKGTTLTAEFTPVDAGIPFGPFRWSVRSRWDGGSDALPRRGTFSGRARLLGVPKCFGAAAQACTNPALKTVVTPTPEEALLIPGAPCTVFRATPLLLPCHLGVAPSEVREWVALLGDSHAEQWRAALEVVAQKKRWRVISLTRAGCPLNEAGAQLTPASSTAECKRWNGAVREWLAAHPEIKTVFLSAHDRSIFAGDPVAGYRAAWALIPRTVGRIYVLRDTPNRVHVETNTCVERLLQARRVIGTRCAAPRELALPPDPEAEAARSAVDDRVRLLDLSHLMCTETLCPPVIGGVLVLKDPDHLTRAFSATLGPYLLQALA